MVIIIIIICISLREQYSSARLSIAWESIPAPLHIFLFCCEPTIRVTLLELGEYVPDARESADAGVTASRVRDFMAREAHLALSSSGLREKREYHRHLLDEGSTT